MRGSPYCKALPIGKMQVTPAKSSMCLGSRVPHSRTMKYCQRDAVGCSKIICLDDKNCTDQMTDLLKSFMSKGGFVGFVMPLVGVFWVFSSRC